MASDVGGHKELIRDGETGMLFAAGSAQSLAQCVLELLQHRERWPQLRTAGRCFVEQERNWRSSVARYVRPYAALAETALAA